MALPQSNLSIEAARGLDLCRDFLDAHDWEDAFGKLDDLCNLIIKCPEIAGSIDLGDRHDAMLSKVAEVDSLCEKSHARRFIQAPVAGSRTPLSEYPWFLYDYYKDEYKFIKEQMGNEPIRHAVHIGHGAIPSLALVLLENEPGIRIDMVDFDKEASQLAQQVTMKIDPQADLSFSTSDVRTCNSESEDDGRPQLIIVTNAPLAVIGGRDKPFDCEHLFIRSATEAGHLLYPRMDTTQLDRIGFRLLEQRKDDSYGIHEWIMAREASAPRPR